MIKSNNMHFMPVSPTPEPTSASASPYDEAIELAEIILRQCRDGVAQNPKIQAYLAAQIQSVAKRIKEVGRAAAEVHPRYVSHIQIDNETLTGTTIGEMDGYSISFHRFPGENNTYIGQWRAELNDINYAGDKFVVEKEGTRKAFKTLADAVNWADEQSTTVTA